MNFDIQCSNTHNYDDILAIMNLELDIPVVTTETLSTTILTILMGTRQIREGSKPNIEYQYDTKKKIDESIKRGETIIIVVPAGPKKPSNQGDFVDLAEYWFLKILHELAVKINNIYEYGIVFNIILEDASMRLFEPDVPHTLAVSYMKKLSALINVLGYGGSINIVPESSLVTPEELRKTGLKVYDSLLSYISVATTLFDTEAKYENLTAYMEKLHNAGWSGAISTETLNYYQKSFRNNYPEKSADEINQAIALYLATSYARYQHGVRDIGIQVANAKRVPGVTFGRYNRIFYRTVPLSKTKTHIPFWRARGVVQIDGEDYLTKLFPFNQTPEVEVNNVMIINKAGVQAELRIDILVD